MALISTFEHLGLQPALLRALHDLKFTEPTPIQQQAIPPALEGRDILASAQTGSGKSAAFGLPIVNALIGRPPGKTYALILVPTRELAEQIATHIAAMAKHSKVRVAAIYGGVSPMRQIAALKGGTEIIVATPGRLFDHMKSGHARLRDVSIVVLDEADRMLDIGFLPIVRRILEQLPGVSQRLLFSATIPPPIEGLVRDILRDPVRIKIAAQVTNVDALTQVLYAVPQDKKTQLFLELLKDNAIFSAIAFTRTKARANRLAAALEKSSIPTAVLHGDRSQAQRTRALDSIKRGKCRVLVATDIAARGIDIVQLGHVVNYDVPMAPEDYVHRVGRTARAQATGDAITFASSEEEPLIRRIEQVLGKRLERSVNPLFPDAPLTPLRSERPNNSSPSPAGAGARKPQGAVHSRRRRSW
jgi:ATP-dependent RNA helicase RhlE